MGLRYQLGVEGPFAYAFNVYWRNSSVAHTLQIVPAYYLTKGTYTLTIPASPVYGSLVVAPAGLSDAHPPTVSLVTSGLTVAPTPIFDYPRILGLASVSLRVSVVDRTNNALRSLVLSANFSQPLVGRSSITLTLPFLTSRVGYFTTGYGVGGTMTWNGYNRTLTFVRRGGWSTWQAANRTVTIALSGAQVAPFFVNDNGIPARGMQYVNASAVDATQGPLSGVQTRAYDDPLEATAYISASSVASQNMAANGTGRIPLFLPPKPIEDVNVLPVVQAVSVRFDPPLFSGGNGAPGSNITLQVRLNTPAMPGDTFQFRLYGAANTLAIGHTNHTNATVPVAVTGTCVLPYVNSTFHVANSTLSITLSSHTTEGGSKGADAVATCLVGRTFLSWSIPGSAGIIAPQTVQQYQSNLIKARWLNSDSSTGWAAVSDAPQIAFVASSLSFAAPYAGKPSPATLKILTANNLQAGDVISVVLHGYHIAASDIYIPGLDATRDLNPPPPQVIKESLSQIPWNWGYNRVTGQLSLQAPADLMPSALQFDFAGALAFTMPSTGVAFAPWKARTVAANTSFALSLQRGPRSLAPQLLQYVQPVCVLRSSTLRSIAAPRTYFRSNSSADDNRNRSTAMPFTTTDNRTVAFQVQIVLNTPLGAGDTVQIYAPHYVFHNTVRDLPVTAGVPWAAAVVAGKNSTFNSSAPWNVAFAARADVATKTITVTALFPMPNTTVMFTVQNHPYITVPVKKCDNPLRRNCPITLSITSTTCPLQASTVYEQSTGLLAYTAIHLATTNVIPTFFPTGQPSMQPTSRPSRTPTTQPTRRPTAPSGQPTSRPSLQPSSEPSSYPSTQPTTNPSREPSSQPTCQPTSPTGQPTREPSSLPTSLPTHPTGQPSMQPSSQPSRIPTSQPSEQPTLQPTSNPTTQPSRCPTNQPTQQPTQHPSAKSSTVRRRLQALDNVHISARTVELSANGDPTGEPSQQPTMQPSQQPTSQPSGQPSQQPSQQPTSRPSRQPTSQPTMQPSQQPTSKPSGQPSTQPTMQPSQQPTVQPSQQPTLQPTSRPSRQPTSQPTMQPSQQPTSRPSRQPTRQPTCQPSRQPTSKPSGQPSTQPTMHPSQQPTSRPSTQPTQQPTRRPSGQPTCQPTMQPSRQPTMQPSEQPTSQPTMRPTMQPTGQPTRVPTSQPSMQPSQQPTNQPTLQPSTQPTMQPSRQPTSQPSRQPLSLPTMQPSEQPTSKPSIPTSQPSQQPTSEPTTEPSSQPSEQPTQQPTSQPSREPSSQPSSQPSRQPSSRPTAPSGQPTCQPSSAPSSEPSNAPFVAYLVIDLSLVLQSRIAVGTHLNVRIPQVLSGGLDSTEPHVVLKYPGMTAPWSVRWHGANDTLALTAVQQIGPGSVQFTIGSVAMALAPTMIYENDPTITYSLTDATGSYTVQGGNFDRVAPRGMRDSSLAFGSVVEGAVTTLDLMFVPENHIYPGDRIWVTLPQFSGPNVSQIAFTGRVCQILSCTTYTRAKNVSTIFTARWVQRTSSIMFIAQQTVVSVHLTMLASNGLMFALHGSNNVTGLPSISMRTRTHFYFAPTPFKQFTPIAYVYMSNVTFARPALAGVATTVYVTVQYSVPLSANDVFDVTLPEFWSTSPRGVWLATDVAQFTAQWLPCAAQLRLISLNATTVDSPASGFFTVAVHGLRLPARGVSSALAAAVTVASNGSLGTVPRMPVQAVQLVPCFYASALGFSPPRLGVPVTVLLTLQLSVALLANDSLSLVLPGVTITTPSALAATNAPYWGSVAWHAETHTLTVNISRAIPWQRTVLLAVNGTDIMLPTEGFPTAASGTGEGSAVRIYTSTARGPINVYAPVDPTPVANVSAVGLIDASVHYTTTSTNAAVGVRFQFQLSTPLAVGDTLVVAAPICYGPPSMTAVTTLSDVSGDLAKDNFTVAFAVAFDPVGHAFTLTAKTADATGRQMSVFVGASNGLLFPAGGYANASAMINVTHTMSGAVAALGGLWGPRLVPVTYEVDHQPIASMGLGLPAPAGVTGRMNVSACPLNTACSFDLTFTIAQPLLPGEMIVFSHASLHRAAGLADALALSGNGSARFQGVWRDADTTYGLAAAGGALGLESAYTAALSTGTYGDPVQGPSYVRPDTAVPFYNVNLTLPSAAVGANTVLVASVPRITSLSIGDCPPVLYPGDELFIHVDFDEAVQVVRAPDASLRLLLNTLEYAHFLDGNGTASLRFVYFLQGPRLATALGPMGPHSMDHFSTGLVSRLGQPLVVANTTVPPPYNFFLRKVFASVMRHLNTSAGGPQQVAVAVQASAKALSGSAAVQRVRPYSAAPHLYAVGDVLDVAVDFSRPVFTVGTPALLLQGSSKPRNLTSLPLLAANVSFVQYVDVDPAKGTFALAYAQPSWPSGDRSAGRDGVAFVSACVAFNDSAGLQQALAALPPLRASLPVSIATFATLTGLELRLVFRGRVAPLLLQGVPSAATSPLGVCDQTARVRVDPNMWQTVVFRRNITAGDTALPALTYRNTSALLVLTAAMAASGAPGVALGNGSIFIRGYVKSLATTTLPQPATSSALLAGGGAGTSVNTAAPVVRSVYANISTALRALLAGTAQAGDGAQIPIVVNFTSNVVVVGHPVLVLNFSSYVYGRKANQTTFTRAVPFTAVSGHSVVFTYTVAYGDIAQPLDVASDSALVLPPGAMILQDAAYPTTPANLSLPVTRLPREGPGGADHWRTLQASDVRVTAFGAPTANRVFTDHPPGEYSAGEVIRIMLNFSTPVVLSPYNTTNTSLAVNWPFINLAAPKGARMYYYSGNGTTTLGFNYTVVSGQSAPALMLPQVHAPGGVTLVAVDLQGGYTFATRAFVNVLGRVKTKVPSVAFANLTLESPVPSDVSQLARVAVNTSLPRVVRVDSANADGTYYPGEYVDVTVVFTKPVCVFPGNSAVAAAARVSDSDPPAHPTALGAISGTGSEGTIYPVGSGGGLPAIELQIPYQPVPNVLATYVSGNCSTEIHFGYVVPVPNALLNVHPLLPLDYANPASLHAYLNGSVFFERANNATSTSQGALTGPVELMLPDAEASYLRYHRKIHILFRVPSVASVYCVNGSGNYAPGDTINIAVLFTQPVMVTSYPPVLRMHSADDSAPPGSLSVNRSALYAAGNGTNALQFAYVIKVRRRSLSPLAPRPRRVTPVLFSSGRAGGRRGPAAGLRGHALLPILHAGLAVHQPLLVGAQHRRGQEQLRPPAVRRVRGQPALQRHRADGRRVRRRLPRDGHGRVGGRRHGAAHPGQARQSLRQRHGRQPGPFAAGAGLVRAAVRDQGTSLPGPAWTCCVSV